MNCKENGPGVCVTRGNESWAIATVSKLQDTYTGNLARDIHARLSTLQMKYPFVTRAKTHDINPVAFLPLPNALLLGFVVSKGMFGDLLHELLGADDQGRGGRRRLDQ